MRFSAILVPIDSPRMFSRPVLVCWRFLLGFSETIVRLDFFVSFWTGRLLTLYLGLTLSKKWEVSVTRASKYSPEKCHHSLDKGTHIEYCVCRDGTYFPADLDKRRGFFDLE